MNPSVRASALAGAIGTLPPLLFVLSLISGRDVIDGLEFLAVLFVLVCPPWQVFWAGIGEPHNTLLWAKLSAIVIASNALIYFPLGLAYVRFSSLRPIARGASVAGVAVVLLGVGHLFFISLT